MAVKVAQGQKNLLLRVEACTGCRLCEMVCSVTKEGESNPRKARIHIESHWTEELKIPRVCINCRNAPCVKACPRGALWADARTGIVILDRDKCDNCGKCIPACPFAAITLTPNGEVVKCDLCGGDPACVKLCETKAIQFAKRVSGTQRLPRAKRAEKTLSGGGEG